MTVVPAALAVTVGLWDLAAPPVWRDEAATISAVGRTLPEMAHLLRTVDAVHGLYYLLTHLVTGVFGTSEVALRAPSVLAGALAAAGVGALGRALGLPRAGLYGGVLLALMPIFSRYVQEARPYPMTMAAAVGVTLLFLRVMRTPRPLVLAGYGTALAVLAYLNLFAVLVAGAHGVAVVLFRGPFARWACATGAALAAVAPLAWLGSRQSAQVGWIPRPEAAELGRLAVQMFGDLGFGDPGFGDLSFGDLGAAGPVPLGVAPLAWALVIFGLARSARGVLARRRAAGRSPYRAPYSLDHPATRDTAHRTAVHRTRVAGHRLRSQVSAAQGYGALVRLALPWLLLPASVLLAASWAAHPVYVFRYVFCCVPAAALLAGAGLAVLPGGVAVAVLAAWIGLSVPGQIATRGPGGRQDDPRPVMALLASAARPGDGVLFVPAKVRKYAAVYPSVFGGLRDVALARSPERDGSFPGREVGPRLLAARLAGLRTLWVVGHTGKAGVPNGRLDLVARAFVPAGRWTSRGLFVARYAPAPAPAPAGASAAPASPPRQRSSNGAGVGK